VIFCQWVLTKRLWQVSPYTTYRLVHNHFLQRKLLRFPLNISVYNSLACYDTINQAELVSCGDVESDMSIAIGLIGTDGIVLATDSRLSRQEGGATYHEDNSQKLWALTETIGLMSTGYNSGYRHFLVDYIQEIILPQVRQEIIKTQKRDMSFIEVVDYCSQTIKEHVARYTKYYDVLKAAGGMDFILAGYDINTPKLFSIDVYNVITPFVPSESYRYCVSGVKDIGIHWIQTIGFNGMAPQPIEFLQKLAVTIILETAKVNDMVAEPIQLAIVDKEGYHDKSIDVDGIKVSLDPQHKWLYDYLATNKGTK